MHFLPQVSSCWEEQQGLTLLKPLLIARLAGWVLLLESFILTFTAAWGEVLFSTIFW